jgi:hypothetical protein
MGEIRQRLLGFDGMRSVSINGACYNPPVRGQANEIFKTTRAVFGSETVNRD